MLIDRKARRLGDLAAGTVCVKERRDAMEDDASPRTTGRRRRKVSAGGMAVADLAVPSSLESLSRLSPEDRYLVQEYLMRRRRLVPGAAHGLAVRIAARISAALGLELKGEPPEDFLARVGSELEGQSRAD